MHLVRLKIPLYPDVYLIPHYKIHILYSTITQPITIILKINKTQKSPPADFETISGVPADRLDSATIKILLNQI